MLDLIAGALAQGGGIVARRNDPVWGAALARHARAGRLARVAPGVYAEAGREREPAVLARAAMEVSPDAVIRGAAAAALTWWPGLAVDHVEASHKVAHRGGHGLTWSRSTVPEELVHEVDGIRFAHPALTVLDLIPTLGGAAIDEALRRRAVSLADLEHALALTRHRCGNAERRWLLADSCDEPWSEPERLLHRGVRDLALPFRHRTNHRVALTGTAALIDLALPELTLGFEVDGFAFHGTRDAFERDRRRNPALAAAGWQIVSFSAAAVLHDLPWVLATILAAVDQRSRLLSDRPPRRRARGRAAERRGSPTVPTTATGTPPGS